MQPYSRGSAAALQCRKDVASTPASPHVCVRRWARPVVWGEALHPVLFEGADRLLSPWHKPPPHCLPLTTSVNLRWGCGGGVGACGVGMIRGLPR